MFCCNGVGKGLLALRLAGAGDGAHAQGVELVGGGAPLPAVLAVLGAVPRHLLEPTELLAVVLTRCGGLGVHVCPPVPYNSIYINIVKQ